MKKIAVVLSGCGYLDGAEVTESVSTLICLSEHQVDYKVFAPDSPLTVVNHNTNEETQSKRNVMVEAARISRGNVKPLSELRAKDFDAIIMPGGYGAAKNLSTFAFKGPEAAVNPDLEKALIEFHEQSKPIGAICISPAVVAKVLGKHQPTVTIGNDAATAEAITKTGAVHEECVVTDYITDRMNKIVTTPAYMYEAKPFEVFTGIKKLVQEVVEMA